MKKHLLFSAFLFLPFGIGDAFSQCNTGWTKIAAGTYPSITLTGNSYIASGDVVNVTGAFTVNANFCNEGTLNASVYSKTIGSYSLTNNATGSITISGNIIMEGLIDNYGSITSQTGTFTHSIAAYPVTNYSGGAIRAYGDITMEGTIDNCGTIEITNAGKFTKISAPYSITNQIGSSILIRSSGLTSQIEGTFINNGIVKIEGRMLQITGSNYTLTNSSTGYFRVCEELSRVGGITNSGTMEALGQIYILANSPTAYALTNNAGATLNVTDDIDINCRIVNSGCITVGDSIYKRNSAAAITLSGGAIYTTNFIQDDGSLIGGASTSIGYLVVSGSSQTLNGVLLSGYLDLCDAGSSGVAPYFDVESPIAYAYPTTNVTDCGSSPPCTKAVFASCSGALPIAAPCVSPPTGIDETLAAQSPLVVFPNPTTGKFRIQDSGFRIYEVQVYNVPGEIVYSAINHQPSTIINLNAPDGLYFISIKSESGITTQKIIKQCE